MRTKYLYLLIAAVTVAAAVYPVAFTILAPSYAKSSPFSCIPFIPCSQPQMSSTICTSTCIIIMKDSTFQPQNIKVSEGATVIWINEDGFPHTSTSYNSSAWSSGFVGPGKEFLLTVNLPPRTYYYHCNIHLQMVGELSVVD